MPKSCKVIISKTVSPNKVKFEAQSRTKNTKLGHKGALPWSNDLLLNFGTNIFGTAEPQILHAD